ncbi:metallo beta lactamase domain containing protein [Echinococcus multilocularis]|uniref:Metallo beta lactamase domain containing protein n=1 Tax=Echinococcus multilocularis TaxID=6211 RepID=A0A068YFJ7_ECHMU|nr:metallo beta lactamase domain containing protein [Echinococcus multilocularis]
MTVKMWFSRNPAHVADARLWDHWPGRAWWGLSSFAYFQRHLYDFSSILQMGSRYPSLPNSSVVHPHVIRLLGQNPGIMTLQGTNSYLVGAEEGPRILIDTTGGEVSVISKYVDLLQSVLQNPIYLVPTPMPEPPISTILLTHWHPDHTEGIAAVQDLVCKLSPSLPDPTPEVYKSPEGPDLKAIGYYDGPLKTLDEKMTFSPPGSPSVTLKPIFTPGHSVDHMCFALSVNDTVECVFVGDLLLGFGTTIVLDLPAYMRSLEVLREFVIKCNNPKLCFMPAHGEVITDPVTKIDEYLAIRKKQINKTRDGLLTNPKDTWLSENSLVEQIYPSTVAKMKQLAMNNLRQCLFWLQAQETTAFHIPQPVTASTKEARCESDFKKATAIARPGYLPEVLNEEWLWKWTSAEKTCNNHLFDNS